jgi:hypothetical protein
MQAGVEAEAKVGPCVESTSEHYLARWKMYM